MRGISVWSLAHLAAQLAFAQQCVNPPSQTSTDYVSYKVSNSAANVTGDPTAQCSGQGNNSLPGTAISFSSGYDSIACEMPSSSSSASSGVTWNFSGVVDSYQAASVCDGNGNICPVAYQIDEDADSAKLEYMNGAIDTSFSTCVGNCVGTDYSTLFDMLPRMRYQRHMWLRSKPHDRQSFVLLPVGRRGHTGLSQL